MGKFLEIYNLPSLNHREMENLNRQISNEENETTINNLLKIKIPGLDVFTSEFYQTFQQDLLPILPKLF